MQMDDVGPKTSQKVQLLNSGQFWTFGKIPHGMRAVERTLKIACATGGARRPSFVDDRYTQVIR
jgi:hypothetical protein